MKAIELFTGPATSTTVSLPQRMKKTLADSAKHEGVPVSKIVQRALAEYLTADTRQNGSKHN